MSKAVGVDMRRPRPRPDPTMPHRTCSEHGYAAQAYIGRERYACWHCAVAEYDRRLEGA